MDRPEIAQNLTPTSSDLTHHHQFCHLTLIHLLHQQQRHQSNLFLSQQPSSYHYQEIQFFLHLKNSARVTTNNQRLLAQELQIKQLAEQTKHLVQIFTEHIASTSRQTSESILHSSSTMDSADS
jgi:hypothetical protein